MQATPLARGYNYYEGLIQITGHGDLRVYLFITFWTSHFDLTGNFSTRKTFYAERTLDPTKVKQIKPDHKARRCLV